MCFINGKKNWTSVMSRTWKFSNDGPQASLIWSDRPRISSKPIWNHIFKTCKAYSIDTAVVDIFNFCKHFAFQHVDCLVYKYLSANSKSISNNLGKWSIWNGYVINSCITIFNFEPSHSSSALRLDNFSNSNCNDHQLEVTFLQFPNVFKIKI